MEIKIIPKSFRTDDDFRKFSPEIRKCYFEGERKLKYFKTYTKAHCEWECKTNKTLEVCGCVKFSMPRGRNTSICDLISLSNCLPEISNCNCYSPCVEIKYEYKIKRAILDRTFLRERETKK